MPLLRGRDCPRPGREFGAMAKPGISLQELKGRFQLSDRLLDAPISEEHLREASRIIDDHESLGHELGFTSAEMTAISSERTVQLQRSATLTKWKQKFAWKATYCKLIDALLKCSRADLAQEVCKLLAQSASPEQSSVPASYSAALPSSSMSDHDVTKSTDGVQHGDLLTTTSHSTPPQSPPTPGQTVDVSEVPQPDVGEVEEEVISQLRQKVTHLETKFEDLLKTTSEYLEKKKIPIQAIRKSLYVRRASDPETDIDLVAGHRYEIREADTVDDLFEILSAGKCWDFLNPGLLKRIIKGHCAESVDIQHQKEEYLEQLQQFRKMTKARQFAKVCSVSTLSPKFSEVVFEMGLDWNNATLEDVEKLKQKIRGQEYLSGLVLSFKRSKNSSLSLVWAFPRSCPISTTILRIPPSFYLEQGIRRVLVKGICMVDIKFEEVHVDAKQVLQLQERLKQEKDEVTTLKEIMASSKKAHAEKLAKAEENLKATIECNEELRVTLEEAKSLQAKLQKENSDLEGKVKKYELLREAAREAGTHVSDSSHLEQEQLQFGTLHLMRDATLGTGAYGQVCKAMLDELPCAAKLLHPTLVDSNNPRNQTMFDQECRFLGKIQHPNIVQYLGIAQDTVLGLPILLMELMDDSLTHFLEQSEEPLAYHVQVNISHDIALAVAFLHLNGIIHRDLSSNNVLLIGAGSRAKVTDFGMSKLTELNPHMTGLTKCPGTPAYMSPEALLDPPVYTEKLDCFQAGVLMIQTITRKFPDPGPAMNRVSDTRYPTGWANVPVPEVKRRQNHLRLILQTHPMLRIAVNCLKDMDTERPSAQQICQCLSALKDTPAYGQSLEGRGGERDGEVQERTGFIQQLTQENKERERERDIEYQLRQKEEEVKEREREVREVRTENRHLQNKVREREREVILKVEEIQRLQKVNQKDQTIHHLQQKQQSAPSYTCLVSGPGLQSATANHPTHVIVEVSSSDGTPLSWQQTVTAKLVLWSISQATSTRDGQSNKTPSRSDQLPAIDAAVTMVSPSRYEVSYTAVRRGQHKLHVLVNGIEISGSPFTLTVYPDPTKLGSPVRVVTDLHKPYGIAVTNCGEMVTEDDVHWVSVLDARGQRVQKFGSRGDKPAQMIEPAGIAVDHMNNIYVSSNHKLQKFTSSGKISKCVGQRGSKEGEFYDPRGITIHSNQVYVCDHQNHRIQVFDLDLNFIHFIGSHGKGRGEFDRPQDVTFDTAGNMYVAEYGNQRVQVMDSSGQFIRILGQNREGNLSGPTALHIADEYVYVSDYDRDCITVFQTSGHFVTSFGRRGHGDGELYGPRCMTSCANGFIHVCDYFNNRVQTF